MKRIKYSSRVMILLVLFWIVYNSIFGWNALPQSQAEINCDKLFESGMYMCFIVFLSPLVGLYEVLVEKHLK